jgi:hypothetical protein
VGFAVGAREIAGVGDAAPDATADAVGAGLCEARGCSLGDGAVVAAGEAMAEVPGGETGDSAGAALVQALNARHRASGQMRDERTMKDLECSAGRNIGTLSDPAI